MYPTAGFNPGKRLDPVKCPDCGHIVLNELQAAAAVRGIPAGDDLIMSTNCQSCGKKFFIEYNPKKNTLKVTKKKF